MSGEGKAVCVTGGSGFIASWLVKHLLLRGYTVHATVLNLRDPNQVAHLLAFDGSNERLHLFEADLLEEKSFDPAIKGCDGVFHTASPVTFSPLATKAELVDPAVKGTLNVLGSCVRTPSVKRVVVTSSTASILIKENPISPDDVVDETWFSDKEYVEENKQWYILSKILAEEAAWKYAKEKGIDMVTLHPCWVIGPMLQPSLSLINQLILDLIKEGVEFSPAGNYRFIDVRDVANAHIHAFELASASGRYCLIGVTVHSSKALKIIGKLYPSLALPDKYKEDLLIAPSYQVSQEKAKQLGITLTSLEVSLRDTVESLKDKNFLNF
nr:cinnamoyl-CoA reductase 1-like [Ipomoea batatas]